MISLANLLRSRRRLSSRRAPPPRRRDAGAHGVGARERWSSRSHGLDFLPVVSRSAAGRAGGGLRLLAALLRRLIAALLPAGGFPAAALRRAAIAVLPFVFLGARCIAIDKSFLGWSGKGCRHQAARRRDAGRQGARDQGRASPAAATRKFCGSVAPSSIPRERLKTHRNAFAW